jgi:hypothetical protein
MFSSLETLSQTYDVTYANASVNFNDPAFGPEGSHYLDTVLAPAVGAVPAIIGETPVTFARLHMQNKSRVEGAEALYVYRPSELPLGGELRLMLGGRYLELKDQFWVDTNGGNLTDSFWDTTTHNEIGGPEIGLRYYQPFGRCGISVDGRFTAGLNAQAAYQNGLLAAYLVSGENAAPLPTLMGAHTFVSSTHWIEFSPIVELRVEAHMQLTNIIGVKAGYTGMFVNNVARAADLVDYTLPNMGITRNLDGNMQQVYIQGLNLSVDICF